MSDGRGDRSERRLRPGVYPREDAVESERLEGGARSENLREVDGSLLIEVEDFEGVKLGCDGLKKGESCVMLDVGRNDEIYGQMAEGSRDGGKKALSDGVGDGVSESEASETE